MITITTRSAMFFPMFSGKGKWHAAHPVDNRPMCGAPGEVVRDHSTMIIIRPRSDISKAHPIVCRKCLTMQPTIEVEG